MVEIEHWKPLEILAVSPLGGDDFLVFTRGYEESSSFETLWAHVGGDEQYVFNFRSNDSISMFLGSSTFRDAFEHQISAEAQVSN
ncbi:MAG: hypothetical protein GC168_04910 [Candidatus Hydrogenedens sp.]|nr:hypothetical protein [Candidatus Hydrogenedens sp.]